MRGDIGRPYINMDHSLELPLLSKPSQGVEVTPEIEPRVDETDFEEVKAILERSSNPLLKTLDSDEKVIQMKLTVDDKSLIILSSRSITVLHSSTFEQIHRFKGSYRSIAVSKDGNLLCAGSNIGAIVVWSLKEEGVPKRILTGHTNKVLCLTISRNGKLLASASKDKTAIIWDLEKTAQEKVLIGHEGRIRLTYFTKDESRIVTVSKDCTVRLWEIQDPNQVKVFKSESGYIRCLAISKNGAYLAAGAAGWAMELKVWSLQEQGDEEAVIKLKDSMGAACLRFSKDGKYLVGARLHLVTFWNVANWKVEKNYEILYDRITSLAFASDGKYLFGGSNYGQIQVFSLQDDTSEKFVQGHTKSIEHSIIAKDGMRLFTASDDKTIKAWKIHEAPKPKQLPNIRSLKISKDGKYIVGSLNDYKVIFWNLIEGTQTGVLEGHTNDITCLAISDDCRYAASGSEDCDAIVWDIIEAKKFRQYSGHFRGVTRILISDDSKLLITGSEDRSVRIWGILEESVEIVLNGHEGYIVCLELTIDKNNLITASDDKTMRIWDIKTSALVKVLTCNNYIITHLAKSKDGKHILSVSDDLAIRVWEIERLPQHRLLTGHTEFIDFIAMSNDGEHFATGSSDNTVIIWSIHINKPQRVLVGHTSSIRGLDFTDDGRHVITSSRYETIIWNVLNGNKLRVLEGHYLSINGQVYNRKHVVTFQHDRPAIVWDISEYVSDCKETSSKEILRYGYQFNLEKLLRYVYGKGEAKHRPEFNNIIIKQYNINILHMLAYENQAHLIIEALNSGCDIIKSIYSESPITTALKRNARVCLDAFLEIIVKFEDRIKSRYTLDAITQDIPSIIETGSKYLVPFLEFLFQQADPVFIIPKGHLPITIFSSIYDIDINVFKSQGNQEDIKLTSLVEMFNTRFRWNFQRGSSESIQLLESINNSPSQEIYRTDLVRSIIDFKWSEIYTIILTLSVLYMINLLLLILIIFYEDISVPIEISSYGFLIINFLFLMYEIYQGIVLKSSYFYDIWNYTDMIRCPLCIYIGAQGILGVTPNNCQVIMIITSLLCWIRGLTHLRTFKYTRIFVSMILSAVKDTSSFLIILFYTTIAYSTLFKISEADIPKSQISDDHHPYTILESMTSAYELDLSSFNTEKYSLGQWIIFILASLLNCIIMLNLLISILGDSYERVQSSLVESDYSQMLDVIIELEKMMVWNRNKGTPVYLHECDCPTSEYSQEEWEGRIKILQDKVSGVSALIEKRFNQALEAQKITDKNLESKFKEAQLAQLEVQKSLESKLLMVEQAQNGMDAKLKEIYEMLQTISRNSQA